MNFDSFCRDAGLMPRDVQADGKWWRCPTESHPRKRNGSYKLAADGLIGWAMDYAVHSKPLTWRPDREYRVPVVDHAAIAKRRSEERRALVRATQAAREFYLSCTPLRDGHPYLKAHDVSMAGCRGLKIDQQGWLVVPVLLDGRLISVQRIDAAGEKRFWPGAPVKAGSYALERLGARITVLCEGLATGLVIFAAAPMTRIVVSFNSGNLGRVAMPRRGLVVVAADNDHATAERTGTNPGLVAATAAAEVLGCGVAVPADLMGSDWSDWRQERIQARLANRGKMERESDIRRAVDAEIAAAMSRNAVYLRGANVKRYSLERG